MAKYFYVANDYVVPFQNNLDELFMLMHFLDAGKVSLRINRDKLVDILTKTIYLIALLYLQFGSLEEFQEEFKDINQEEQISRLHRMLAPHLLRSTFFSSFSA